MDELTSRGRLDAIWYRLRRLIITPAPDWDRCVMGAPIGDHIRCPRRTVEGSIWCRRHCGSDRGSE